MHNRVIILGTEELAFTVYQTMQTSHNIIAYCPTKTPTKHLFTTLPIIPLHMLANTAFEYLLIAVKHTQQNKVLSLLQSLNISSASILYPHTSDLKQVSFQDKPVLEMAQKALCWVTQALNASPYAYYLDGGTLLGIARGGNLIPWDNDLDLSILAEDTRSVYAHLEQKLDALETLTQCSWTLKYLLHKTSNDIWAAGDIRKIYFKASNNLTMALIARYQHNDFRYYSAVSRLFRNSAHYFSGNETLMFQNTLMKVPKNYKNFLTETYGNWKEEKQDWTYEDYPCLVK
jgi:hypothetical protein